MTHSATAAVNLFSLFENARESGIKYPAVSLSTTDYRIRLSLATRGYIAIKVNGEYIGRADKMMLPEGPGYDLRIYQYKELTELIDSVIGNPTSELAIQGRKQGSCCFCNRHLDTAISVAMGYGPICAEKYGLPWEILPSFPQESDL